MRFEVLLLLAAWVGTFGLIVVIPWAVIGVVSGVLDVSEARTARRRAALAHEPSPSPSPNTKPTEPPTVAVNDRLHPEIEPTRTRPRL